MADRGPLRLVVAGLAIEVRADDPRLRLAVEGASRAFLHGSEAPWGGEPPVEVRASYGESGEAPRGERIFDSGGLWQLFAREGSWLFRFTSPALGRDPYKEASFAADFSRGEVRLDPRAFPPGKPVNPLEYPLDELLMVNLLAAGRGVEVHGCGLLDADGTGWLFPGQSGAGKTTMARQWEAKGGALILSDDRIIIREEEGRLWMHGTPWHGEARLASPRKAVLSRVCFLRHATEHRLTALRPAEAASRLFAASFPPFHSGPGLDFSLGFLGRVAVEVPCCELDFLPRPSVVDFLRDAARD